MTHLQWIMRRVEGLTPQDAYILAVFDLLVAKDKNEKTMRSLPVAGAVSPSVRDEQRKSGLP